MNKNNIHFQVRRTKGGTIVEVVSGLLVLISLLLSILLLSKSPEDGVVLLVNTLSVGFGVLLVLALAYCPTTFNIPDDSPAELFAATVLLLRITALWLGLLMLSITLCTFFGFSPTLVSGVWGLLFVPLLCWYFRVYMKAKRITYEQK